MIKKAKDNKVTDIVKEVRDGEVVEVYLNKKGQEVKVVVVKE